VQAVVIEVLINNLYRASNFEAAEAASKVGSSLKSNYKKQTELAQIGEMHLCPTT
jgi:hypothetical protein